MMSIGNLSITEMVCDSPVGKRHDSWGLDRILQQYLRAVMDGNNVTGKKKGVSAFFMRTIKNSHNNDLGSSSS